MLPRSSTEQNWFLVTADAVMTGEQRFGSIVVLTNITERKLAEETLRHTEKLAATGRLAQTIAHEINNPLEALTNLIYLSMHTDDQQQIQEFLKQATRELERVAKITKQILSFHRETKIAVELDFQDMVQSVLALYVVQMEAKHITVDYKKGPAFCIHGFPGELRQVFANLIGNAIDASPDHGSLCIRIRKGTFAMAFRAWFSPFMTKARAYQKSCATACWNRSLPPKSSKAPGWDCGWPTAW